MSDVKIIVDTIVEALGNNLCSPETPVPLHEPLIGDNEKKHLNKCIDDGWTSTAGIYVTEFEDKLAALCNVEHVIACVNGTAALHIALKLSGVESGDEVIVPALTFVATANAILYCNAAPHFVDVSNDDYGIDADLLAEHMGNITERKNGQLYNKETGRRIAAILPVHCFGYACNIDKLTDLAHEYSLPLIEDATEALGSRSEGKNLGSFGLFGTLSFNGNKIITTGGGGAITTNNKRLADKARHLTTTAKVPHPWAYHHDTLGYNYRLPSLNAAMGMGQLERLDLILEKKRKIHQRYSESLSNLDGVDLLEGRKNTQPNHWLNTMLLSANQDLNELLSYSNGIGLKLRPVWEILPDQPYLSDFYKTQLDNARNLVSRTVSLPSSPYLADHL